MRGFLSEFQNEEKKKNRKQGRKHVTRKFSVGAKFPVEKFNRETDK